uniref:Uncharacterized protein n=1 Tax=Salvator merianae TaxID=96440 RepID=A0A8D0E7S5_SALMN
GSHENQPNKNLLQIIFFKLQSGLLHMKTSQIQNIFKAREINGNNNQANNIFPRLIRYRNPETMGKISHSSLDKLMPHRTFTDINTSTSAKNSRATVVNHKDAYCVGEQLLVQLDVYDWRGRRKEYGGDFLRARISSSRLQAGASGLITDLRNGTYLVNFTLFWEGTIKVSLLLMHPSEGVSALWAARKKGYDKIAFTGKFLNGTSEVLTECGFAMNTTAELCKYVDERDQEAFYCMKPSKVPCEAFIQLKSQNTPISYVTPLEQSLFQSSFTSWETQLCGNGWSI